MDERAYYTDSQTTKPATLNCPYCRTQDTYELHWSVRKKKDRLPGGADERDRAKFAKAQATWCCWTTRSPARIFVAASGSTFPA